MISRQSLSVALLLLFAAGAPAQPKLVLNTSSIDFGNVKLGTYDPRLGWATLLLTNQGTDTLRVADVSFTRDRKSVV
jgi:hypothetical protein